MAVEAMPHHGGHRFRDFIILVLMVVIAKLLFFKYVVCSHMLW
jgi:hypothetical protein